MKYERVTSEKVGDFVHMLREHTEHAINLHNI